jgi:hypothetical protein
LVVAANPSEKCEFVSWDNEIPNWMESHEIHVPNHQPEFDLTIKNCWNMGNENLRIHHFSLPPRLSIFSRVSLELCRCCWVVGKNGETWGITLF